MKQANDFAYDMLDLDVRKDKLLYYCSRDVILQEEDGDVNITTTFKPVRHNGIFEPAGNAADEKITFTLKAYDDEVLRFSGSFNGEVPDEKSVMLSLDTSLDKRPLSVCPVTGGWELRDDQRNVRMRILTEAAEERHWSDFIRKAYPMFQAELFPDGKTSVPFMSYDQFFPGKLDSVSLGFTRDGMACQSLFSLYSRPNEHFTGTGERFARMDLSGRTITLENTDALGVNSRKTYLNVPFYLSSRGYGLFIHSSSHMRLSFADISTRAVQGLLERRGDAHQPSKPGERGKG